MIKGSQEPIPFARLGQLTVLYVSAGPGEELRVVAIVVNEESAETSGTCHLDSRSPGFDMLPEGANPDTTGTASDVNMTQTASRARDVYYRASRWVRTERLLLAVLLGIFLARLLVGDRNSYWLDEVYAVSIHGSWNDSLTDLVRTLADQTIYPPLYFVALFEWMNWFGDAEFATRLLSNIFVTLAGVFLYMTMRVGFSRRIALLSVIAFSLLYTTMYYGLETRPYAQTIFLVTLSSYLLLCLLRRSTHVGWKHSLISPMGSAFTVVNAAVLLTHYYNVLFWIAQGLAAGVYVLWDMRSKRWLNGLSTVVALYGMQGAIFLGVWGRNTLDAIDRHAATNTIEGASELPNPLSVMLNSIVLPNLDTPTVVNWTAIALVLVLLASAIIALTKPSALEAERLKGWMTLYLFIWLFLPFGVAYLVFLGAGLARFSERYFVFAVVPLAPLLVLTIEQAVYMLARFARRLRGKLSGSEHMRDGWKRWATVLSGLMILVLILPGTIQAVTEPKDDWRGAARQIVEIVESNPDTSYVVYETSFRSIPLLDYHLARYSDHVRVVGTIPRSQERRGEFSFEKNLDVIGQHDFLIVPFIHHRVEHFPKALAKLEELYEEQFRELDDKGKGIVIFSVTGNG